MQVETRPHPVGIHRARYELTWHDWALPLRIVFAQAWLPNAESAVDDLRSWDHQRFLVFHILFARLELVVTGPLWPEETDEEDE